MGIMRGFHRGSGPSASAQRVARRAQRSGADKTRYCAPVCQRLVAGIPVRGLVRELDSKGFAALKIGCISGGKTELDIEGMEYYGELKRIYV